MAFRKLAITLFLCFLGQTALACEEGSIDIMADSGKFRFNISVADDELERAQGLMHVEKMEQFEGMLFIYEQPLHASFWMKNTLIPLDMLFADPTGTITHIHENAVPMSEDTIDGGKNVLYVLEINGGLASKFGIEVGAVLKHPAIDQTVAAWTCTQ